MPPRRAIVHEHARGQAGGGQLGLYRGALVVGTGPQGQIEPGVIIEHRQRMAALVIQGKVPFEVHLPQAIGVRMLETLIVSRLSRRVAGSSKP